MQFCCSPKRLQLFTCIVGAVSIVTVLIILFLSNYPTFAKEKLIEAVTFKDGSIEFARFKTTSDLVNLRLEIHVYNVTNVNDVINNNSRIKVQQIGPFVYHELKTKDILDNNQTSGLITYKLRKRYTFRPELSVGDPKKLKINWLNIPLIAAKPTLDKLNLVKRTMAYIAFNQFIKMDNEPAFFTDTIENLVFTGSKRKLFDDLQSVAGAFFKPWPLPDNKFAVLYNRNDTWLPGRDYIFTMSAGFGEGQTYRDLNQYKYMNGSDTLPFWRANPPYCNQLRGTDGEFFSPFLNSSQIIEAYSSDICRKLALKYREATHIDGITVFKYSLDSKSLQSSKKNPLNDCYCLARDDKDLRMPECDLDGLIDLSTCVAPNVLASGSHFLYGSPKLRERVLGIPQANISTDEPLAYVEPNTGLTIQVKVPLQLNVRLEKGSFDIFNWFQDDEPLIVPIMTVAEAAEMTSDQASMLRNKLLVLDSWLVSMVLGGTIIFILAIISAIVVIIVKVRRSRQSSQEPGETDPLLQSNDASNGGAENLSVHSQQIDDNQRGSTYRTI